jgi:predicted enzyme related to lactoylglutathione lyase
MLKNNESFSSFSIDDVAAAKKFYGEILGLGVEEMSMGLSVKLRGDGRVFIYPKHDHVPATFTVLNFIVDDIDDAVDELSAVGITFEQYDGHIQTDEKGILRSSDPSQGPSIAWFKDPAGNVISVLER